jgi:peptidoglycan hydrolase-like protein with peptidoglycan-binding domain
MDGTANVPDIAAERIDRLVRAAGPARKLARGETTLTRMIWRRFMRAPLQSLGLLAGAGAAGAVLFNLMLMQPERHRAPMFIGNPQIHAAPVPSAAPLPPQRPTTLERDTGAVRRTELVRELQTELGRRGFFIGEPDPAAAARTTQAIRDFQAAASLPVNGQASEALLAEVMTSKLRAKDQILSLLRASAGPLERPETVAALQRALNRLNYGPLKDDGQFGAGTRAALDRFERDRKLSPRGDNPARVLRELSQASGIAID